MIPMFLSTAVMVFYVFLFNEQMKYPLVFLSDKVSFSSFLKYAERSNHDKRSESHKVLRIHGSGLRSFQTVSDSFL